MGRKIRLTAIVLASGIVAIATQEYAVRLALPASNPAAHIRFIPDAKYGLLLGAPNTVQRQVLSAGDYDVTIRFNRFGLRGSHDLSTGTADDYYVVGDSFAFGWGVRERERFSNRLEALIGKRVINLSTPANIDGYEHLLELAVEHGAKPRKVIVAINMIDDLVLPPESDMREAPMAVPDAKERPKDILPFSVRLLGVKQFLLSNSALYFMLTSMAHRWDWLEEKLVAAGLIIPIRVVFGRPPTNDEITRSTERLGALAKRFDTHILVIPSRGLWVGNDRDKTDRPHRFFVGELGRLGLRFVDMRPVMEHSGNPMQYHFANDGHWKPTGHMIAAESLARALATKSTSR